MTHPLLGRAALPGVLLLATYAGTARADETAIGIEAQAGRTAVKSANNAEVDKAGPAFGGNVFVRRPTWGGAYQLGLGWQESQVKGDNHNRGVKSQDLSVRTPYLEGRYLLGLPLGFEAGVALRDYVGKGADFDVQKLQHTTNAIALAPVVGYSHAFGDWTAGVSAAYYMNFQRTDRQVTTLLGGLSLSYRFPVEPAPIAAAPATSAVEPAPTLATIVAAPELADMQVNVATFAFGSARLPAQTKAQLNALGAKLAKTMPAGKVLRVSGHTDIVGPRGVNDRLSLARAKAVRNQLVLGGLAPDLVTAEGHAFDEMLPKISPRAREQRRVALLLTGIDAVAAHSTEQVITAAIHP